MLNSKNETGTVARYPKLEIKIDGTRSRIFSDGVEINGVRKYTLEHSSESRDVPVLHLDLIATQCTVSGNYLPALPEVYAEHYIKREYSLEEDQQ